MAITTIREFEAALQDARTFDFCKESAWVAAPVLLWMKSGSPPAGAAPWGENGTYYDSSSDGAMLMVPAPFGKTNYIVRAEITASVIQTLDIVDLIWGIGELSGASTESQGPAIPPSLPRWAAGHGVECWFLSHGLGESAAEATLHYTNSRGHSGRTSRLEIPGGMENMRALRFPLHSDDGGVRTIEGVRLSHSTGGGTFSLFLLRRILRLPVPVAREKFMFDVTHIGMPMVPNHACLTFISHHVGRHSGWVQGSICVAAG